MYSSMYTAHKGSMYRRTSGRIRASFSDVVRYEAAAPAFDGIAEPRSSVVVSPSGSVDRAWYAGLVASRENEGRMKRYVTGKKSGRICLVSDITGAHMRCTHARDPKTTFNAQASQ
jgi:hypothetical protein